MQTIRALALVLNVLGSLAHAQALWSAQSGGYEWTLDAIGLQVSQKGQTRTLWKAESLTQVDPEGECVARGKFKVISLVGPYLSYEIRQEQKCAGAEAGLQSVHWSVVHAASIHAVKLTELFPENEVYKSLRNHPVLRAAKPKSAPAPIRSLAGIESQLGASTLVYERGNQQCFASFDHALERFAIWKVDKGQVLVKLSVPLDGVRACTEAPLELDLTLRVSPFAKRMLDAAEARKEGFSGHFSEEAAAILEIN